MKTHTTIAIAAAALMAGAMAATPSSAAINSGSAPSAITLTKVQSKAAWKDLHSKAITVTPRPKFAANVGVTVPSTVPLMGMSSKAAHTVPKLKSYDYTMARGKLLIVNPKSRKIVDVVNG